MTAMDGSLVDFTGGPPGVDITADATAHVKNTTYETLIASTSADSTYIDLVIGPCVTQAVSFLIDIALGAATFESVVIPNVFYAHGSDDGQGLIHLEFPFVIPSGSRISAACQASKGGSAFTHVQAIVGFDTNNFPTGDTIEAYGVTTGTTRATVLDNSGSSGVYGDWTPLVASLANDIDGFAMTFGWNDDVITSRGVELEIGIGADPNEVAIVGPILMKWDSVSDTLMPQFLPYLPLSLASGTRISARWRSLDFAVSEVLEAALYTLRTA